MFGLTQKMIVNKKEPHIKIPIQYGYNSYYYVTSLKTISKYLLNTFNHEQATYQN